MEVQLDESDGGLFYLDSPDNFYSTTKYWDDRYKKTMNVTENDKKDNPIYEWFMGLEVVMKSEIISGIINQLKKDQESRPVKILDVGCGNSGLCK